MARDEFPPAVKDALSKRVALRCSNPTCQTPTHGPHSEADRALNIGVASHITAAAEGGPRFDSSLTSTERKSIENAIWLCQNCAKIIDNDIAKYPIALLRTWKIRAEAKALRDLEHGINEDFLPQPPSAIHAPIPRILGLIYDDARSQLLRAGWQPKNHHWSHEGNFRTGNGFYFWRKGYWEIVDACPTGLAHCTFAFIDVYGNTLIVTTAGEAIEEHGANAHVWNIRLAQDT